MIFLCGSVYFGQQVQKDVNYFSITTSRGTPVEELWTTVSPVITHLCDQQTISPNTVKAGQLLPSSGQTATVGVTHTVHN
jgi:hypothetical protein